MSNAQSVESTLQRIAEFLENHHAPGFADRVRRVIDLLNNNDSTAYEELASTAWWGGAGSMIDLLLPASGLEERERMVSEIEYLQLLKVLASELLRIGVPGVDWGALILKIDTMINASHSSLDSPHEPDS